mmetsp:Transcript_12310/g.26571  ORF Transcript_12310/g.26571 Transcript_12310/m.26571 type:complete len:628 (-) Transcript_12310:726-2609(-)|eukprot:CAMPEP_0202896978 /NCGR_PEP_ID=MMETSP1392-20130828/5862_1 /ASSEMBLY_ACC=CAM_ASM_000868 /TAXON_ID=225041 /ORGANISM="Chlamydomonas chlamydogama, Strain SAG 11-48b" /LENGTH=627 /DNA_ID=CAMNT_0049582509 /DNA_START=197 /DNA_END=2080 /DNA_ORIENTATION=-
MGTNFSDLEKWLEGHRVPILVGAVAAGLGLSAFIYLQRSTWLPKALHAQELETEDASLVDEPSHNGVNQWAELLEDTEPDVNIPDEYKDPISFAIIKEPVLLCATGQVYCYHTLRSWFMTGNRICPKTNIEVLDAQIARLPWLKQQIHSWMRAHGMNVPAAEDPMEELRAINPLLPTWIVDIRGDTGAKRTRATADLYEMLRQWEALHGTGAEALEQHRLVREAVMDDMVWLIRYGDPYLQGVAASVLAYCDTPEEVQWLAAVAAVPAVLLCLSPNHYTSQAATRMLYNISRAGDVARRTIKVSGGVLSLLKIISTERSEYGYCRDRAAATLAVLSKDPEVKVYLRSHALQPLKTMLLGSDDRWEKRDAATALLKLQYTQEELGTDITIERLCEYWWCSRAWLEGGAAAPNEGYTEEELQARADLVQMQLHAHDLMDQLLGRDLDIVEAAAAAAADMDRAAANNGEAVPEEEGAAQQQGAAVLAAAAAAAAAMAAGEQQDVGAVAQQGAQGEARDAGAAGAAAAAQDEGMAAPAAAAAGAGPGALIGAGRGQPARPAAAAPADAAPAAQAAEVAGQLGYPPAVPPAPAPAPAAAAAVGAAERRDATAVLRPGGDAAGGDAGAPAAGV